MYSACRKTTDSVILETGETGQYKQGQLPRTRMTMSELTE
jgi:hypothetical protein